MDEKTTEKHFSNGYNSPKGFRVGELSYPIINLNFVVFLFRKAILFCLIWPNFGKSELFWDIFGTLFFLIFWQRFITN